MTARSSKISVQQQHPAAGLCERQGYIKSGHSLALILYGTSEQDALWSSARLRKQQCRADRMVNLGGGRSAFKLNGNCAVAGFTLSCFVCSLAVLAKCPPIPSVGQLFEIRH